MGLCGTEAKPAGNMLEAGGYETQHKARDHTDLCAREEQCKQTNPIAVIKNLLPVAFLYLLGH